MDVGFLLRRGIEIHRLRFDLRLYLFEGHLPARSAAHPCDDVVPQCYLDSFQFSLFLPDTLHPDRVRKLIVMDRASDSLYC